MDDTRGVRGAEHVEDVIGEQQDLLDREPPAAFAPVFLQRRAVQQLHHHEHRAVVGGVVVEDRHDPVVPHAARDVSLALEARPRARVAGQLGIEDLDCDLPPVSVRGRINDRCSTPSKQPANPPFAAQQPAGEVWSSVSPLNPTNRHGND